MKTIYVNEKLNPAKLLSFIKSKKMEQYLVDKINRIDVYSKEGMFHINESNTYKQYIESEEVENKIINNVNYLIYKSVGEKKLVYQIPSDHINVHSIILKYALNRNSPWKLIIECINIDNGDNIKPIDYYFEIDSKSDSKSNYKGDYDISNFATDSSVFLSLLN
jgi:hypothetical protein